MTQFVLDASVTVNWALEDEESQAATTAFELMRDGAAIVPQLWWFEARNALLIAERRGRLPAFACGAFLAMLARLKINNDGTPNEAALLGLARLHRLTVYDAAYLELAIRRSLPLATLDRALARAAETEGVALIGA